MRAPKIPLIRMDKLISTGSIASRMPIKLKIQNMIISDTIA